MDRLGDILSHKAPLSAGDASPVMNQESHPDISKINPSFQEKNSELKTLIGNIKKDLDHVLRLLDGDTIPLNSEQPSHESTSTQEAEEEPVIEGVFNGVKMIGDDGNAYDVAPNYASKSKLVEGDMMKLTINKQGSFIYKQIGPIERQRIRGTLFYNEPDSQWNIITSTGKSYKILTASVTFYKGKAGAEVIAFIPQNGHSEWAAVEHIISQ